MVVVLLVLLWAEVGALGLLLYRRARRRVLEEPSVATHLKRVLRRVLRRGDTRPRGIVLRDNEYGLSCAVKNVLQAPDGLLPVLVKQDGDLFAPGQSRPSHLLELTALLLCCRGDGRLKHAVPGGVLRYVDAEGRPIPGRDVPVAYSPQLHDWVVALLQEVRRARVTGAEAHRTHQAPGKCARCDYQNTCGEACSVLPHPPQANV
jgi:hypothetical protein